MATDGTRVMPSKRSLSVAVLSATVAQEWSRHRSGAVEGSNAVR